LSLLACGVCPVAGAASTGRGNLFADHLGRSEAQVDAKLARVWRQFTTGDAENARLYFEIGDDRAYILDVGNNDVRSEGMSYGMMIAVQLDDQARFNRLWTWARTHMAHPADGPRAGYFAWQCRRDGGIIDPGSASDGEEWFAMALFFASHRWGDGEGIFNYRAEAQALLRAMRRHERDGVITAIFHPEHKQVVFAPTPDGSELTDPSYHLPAFTELWAQWDEDPEGRQFWREVTDTSRAFFRRAAHPVTGLMPEYANFDGSPFTNPRYGPGKGDFRFDAWRTLGNVGLDHAWWTADPWQVEQSNRVLQFLGRWGRRCPNQFTLEGEPLSRDTSVGLTAMAAVAALAAEREYGEVWVRRLWAAPIPEGRWRYYDGLLYLLGLLQVSGRFEIHAP
jgi:oligosaccharide reducing-end xylanase